MSVGDGLHFDRVAAAYHRGRPPYPPQAYDELVRVTGLRAGTRVLDVGAGSGLATAELVARGAAVTAVEPGPRFAAALAHRFPDVAVAVGPVEEVALPDQVDVVVAATALHWVDLDRALPRLHAVLRPGGWLAAWWNVFGDPAVSTPFRRAVDEISHAGGIGYRGTPRPLQAEARCAELAAGGLFAPRPPSVVRWSIELTTAQLRDLFTTFPTWTPDLVDRIGAAADELGGTVTEHYLTVLYLAQRLSREPSSG